MENAKYRLAVPEALDFFDGSIRRGHPLNMGGEIVYFRGARLSPHSGTVLVTVADLAGGVLAVEASELSDVRA